MHPIAARWAAPGDFNFEQGDLDMKQIVPAFAYKRISFFQFRLDKAFAAVLVNNRSSERL
jgi:hypothetical protein